MLALYLAYLDNEDDKELLGNIYKSYKKQMVAVAVDIVHNDSDAEDVVEDVFTCIARKYFDIVRDIKDKNDLRNYLLKAAKNMAYNRLKYKNKENISLDMVLQYNINGIEELSDNSFIEYLCNKMDREQIVNAIESLSETYRYALYYHFVMELPIPQTAKLLNQPLSTTKKQLIRGKKILLSLLKAEGDEDNGNQ